MEARTNHTITSEQQSLFRSTLRELTAVNVLSLLASYASEFGVGHSAPSINNVVMDTGDVVIPVGIALAERNDRAGNHIRAARLRQVIYLAHIGLAAYGISESAHLLYDGEVPKPANVAIAVGSGAVNLHLINRQRRRTRPVSPTDIPGVGSAAAYDYNNAAQEAMAATNVWESVGSIGTISQLLLPFGASGSVIVSNGMVIRILARNLVAEQRHITAMQRAGMNDATHIADVESI